MKCAEVRAKLFRKIDGELSESEIRDLDDHIQQCHSCARDYNLLALPHRMASGIPPVAPSPFFYKKLRFRIESEAQSMAGWQLFWRIARHMVPALAGVTLALLSALVYLQLQNPKADVYRDYQGVLISEEQPNRMLIVDQGDITDASVLNAIAQRQSGFPDNNKK